MCVDNVTACSFVYSREYQDKKASNPSLNYRTWFWQKCSQVGYFRSGGNSKPFDTWSKVGTNLHMCDDGLREGITIGFFPDICMYVRMHSSACP